MDNSTSLIDDKTCALGATRGQHFFFDWILLCVSCFFNDVDLEAFTGYIFPLIDETNMPLVVRCILYFVGLIWSFLAVSIVADIFMCAIEGELRQLYYSSFKFRWNFF